MEKIVFEDLPSTKTPLNANNLNTIQENVETAINETNTNLKTLINGIVESGNNSNGNYIKYSDGTMICTKLVTVTAQCSTTWGSMYESENVSFGATPQTFIEVPMVFPYASTRTALIEGLRDTTINDFGNTWLARPIADQNQIQYTINLLAIGRWK
jgi:hypothetical protein